MCAAITGGEPLPPTPEERAAAAASSGSAPSKPAIYTRRAADLLLREMCALAAPICARHLPPGATLPHFKSLVRRLEAEYAARWSPASVCGLPAPPRSAVPHVVMNVEGASSRAQFHCPSYVCALAASSTTAKNGIMSALCDATKDVLTVCLPLGKAVVLENLGGLELKVLRETVVDKMRQMVAEAATLDAVKRRGAAAKQAKAAAAAAGGDAGGGGSGAAAPSAAALTAAAGGGGAEEQEEEAAEAAAAAAASPPSSSSSSTAAAAAPGDLSFLALSPAARSALNITFTWPYPAGKDEPLVTVGTNRDPHAAPAFRVVQYTTSGPGGATLNQSREVFTHHGHLFTPPTAAKFAGILHKFRIVGATSYELRMYRGSSDATMLIAITLQYIDEALALSGEVNKTQHDLHTFILNNSLAAIQARMQPPLADALPLVTALLADAADIAKGGGQTLPAPFAAAAGKHPVLRTVTNKNILQGMATTAFGRSTIVVLPGAGSGGAGARECLSEAAQALEPADAQAELDIAACSASIDAAITAHRRRAATFRQGTQAGIVDPGIRTLISVQTAELSINESAAQAPGSAQAAQPAAAPAALAAPLAAPGASASSSASASASSSSSSASGSAPAPSPTPAPSATPLLKLTPSGVQMLGRRAGPAHALTTTAARAAAPEAAEGEDDTGEGGAPSARHGTGHHFTEDAFRAMARGTPGYKDAKEGAKRHKGMPTASSSSSSSSSSSASSSAPTTTQKGTAWALGKGASPAQKAQRTRQLAQAAGAGDTLTRMAAAAAQAHDKALGGGGKRARQAALPFHMSKELAAFLTAPPAQQPQQPPPPPQQQVAARKGRGRAAAPAPAPPPPQPAAARPGRAQTAAEWKKAWQQNKAHLRHAQQLHERMERVAAAAAAAARPDHQGAAGAGAGAGAAAAAAAASPPPPAAALAAASSSATSSAAQPPATCRTYGHKACGSGCGCGTYLWGSATPPPAPPPQLFGNGARRRVAGGGGARFHQQRGTSSSAASGGGGGGGGGDSDNDLDAGAPGAPAAPAAPSPNLHPAFARAHARAHALRASAEGLQRAHLEAITDLPGPGHTDILIALQGAIDFLHSARARVRADFAAHKAARVDSSPDDDAVYYQTLGRVLGGYEKKLRRSKRGRTTAFHGTIAMELIAAHDVILEPDIPVRQWSRRSGHTVRVMCLGEHLPRMARKCRQYGRRLVCSSEDFTTQQCPHCGHCEYRGSDLFITCSQCGLASHRDVGMAPSGILKRALVHSAEARLGMLAVAGGSPGGGSAAGSGGGGGGAGGSSSSSSSSSGAP